jgi:hypothetical protein
MRLPAQIVLAALAWIAAGQTAHAQTLHAADFKGLGQMERACAAQPGGRCTLVVSTLQQITLAHPHTLPAGIALQFTGAGAWVVNGAPLTIASGLVEAPPARRIFAGTAAIEGLRNARPEWFALPAPDGVYPAQALASAYRATLPWGTVLLNAASYVSPFYDPTRPDACGQALAPYTSPRRLLGVARPHVDDGRNPTRLLGGTVILGEICGTAPLQAAHLGVDAGPLVVRTLYHGLKPNGIYLPSHGALNPKRGTHLADVAVLTNDSDGEHSVLLEGEDGALVEGLWIWTPGGTHGLILKSAHSTVRDLHCTGASADCLLVKGDYRTAANGRATDDLLDGVHIRYRNTPGDTGGIELDARWDTVQRIALRNLAEDGTSYGLRGEGSWFYSLRDVTFADWSANGLTGPCTDFVHSARITLQRSVCNGRSLAAVAQPRHSWLAELKPQLRILWTTLVTWLGLAWQWLRGLF